jgi:hypothetical protein
MVFDPATATEHYVGVPDDTNEHVAEVVIPIWRLLSGLGGKYRVGHQEYRDFRLFLLLQECQRKLQGVEAAFSPVGWVIDDHEDFHGVLHQYKSIHENT